MDHIADVGSNWSCGALSTLGLWSIEQQTCGSMASRYVTGLATMAAISLLLIVVATYLFVGRAR